MMVIMFDTDHQPKPKRPALVEVMLLEPQRPLQHVLTRQGTALLKREPHCIIRVSHPDVSEWALKKKSKP